MKISFLVRYILSPINKNKADTTYYGNIALFYVVRLLLFTFSNSEFDCIFWFAVKQSLLLNCDYIVSFIQKST